MVSFRSPNTARVFPILLVIVIVVIAIAALLSLAQVVFSGVGSRNNAVDPGKESLVKVDDSRSVSVTVRGPIVADENFHSYRIVVSPSERSITTYNGYLGRVVDSKTLKNNVAAYEEFVFALDRAEFSDGTPYEDERNDVRGVCASGRVHEFTTLQDKKPVETLWSATCRSENGSFTGNADLVVRLFQDQIPDVSTLTRAIRL